MQKCLLKFKKFLLILLILNIKVIVSDSFNNRINDVYFKFSNSLNNLQVSSGDLEIILFICGFMAGYSAGNMLEKKISYDNSTVLIVLSFMIFVFAKKFGFPENMTSKKVFLIDHLKLLLKNQKFKHNFYFFTLNGFSIGLLPLMKLLMQYCFIDKGNNTKTIQLPFQLSQIH